MGAVPRGFWIIRSDTDMRSGNFFGQVVVCDLSDEAIAATRQSLYVAGPLGIVGERAANLVNGEINPTFEIDKGRVTPKASLYVLTGHDLTSALREQQKIS